MVCGLRRWRQLSDKAARRTYATDWRPQKKWLAWLPSVLHTASKHAGRGVRKRCRAKLIVLAQAAAVAVHIAFTPPATENPSEALGKKNSIPGSSHCGPRRSGRATHQFGASNSSGRASVTPKTITAAPMPSRTHAWTQRYLRLCGVALPVLLVLHATRGPAAPREPAVASKKSYAHCSLTA